jgi:hypothetical protein
MQLIYALYIVLAIVFTLYKARVLHAPFSILMVFMVCVLYAYGFHGLMLL